MVRPSTRIARTSARSSPPSLKRRSTSPEGMPRAPRGRRPPRTPRRPAFGTSGWAASASTASARSAGDRRFGCQTRVLGDPLDQIADALRQAALVDGFGRPASHERGRLDDRSIGEIGDLPRVREVEDGSVLRAVAHGRHDRDREVAVLLARPGHRRPRIRRVGLVPIARDDVGQHRDDLLGSGASLRALLREHLVVEPEVLQVEARHEPQLAEQRHHAPPPRVADLGRRHLVQARPHVAGPIGAVDPDRAGEGHVVHPGRVELDRMRIHAHEVREERLLAGRLVAQAEEWHRRPEPGHRLADDLDRVRVVEQDRTGRSEGPHLLRDLEHDRDRAQRHREPARSRGLLPDHAVVDRDPLVEVPGRQAAGTERGEDQVGPVDRTTSVTGRLDPDVRSAPRPQDRPREPRLQLERVTVDVLQHDRGPRERRVQVRDRERDAGHVRRTAADDADARLAHMRDPTNPDTPT